MIPTKEMQTHIALTQLSVSPDGHSVAFVVRQRSAGGDGSTKSLWLYDIQTEECYKLLEDAQFLGYFCWEDASHLFYLARGYGKSTWCRRYYVETLVDDEICVIPDAAEAVWRTGERYVFSCAEGERGLYTMSVRGGKVTRLTPEGCTVEQVTPWEQGLYFLIRTGDSTMPGIGFLAPDAAEPEQIVEEGKYPVRRLGVDADPVTGLPRVSFVAENRFYTVTEEKPQLLPVPPVPMVEMAEDALRFGVQNDFLVHEGRFYSCSGEENAMVLNQTEFHGHTEVLAPEVGSVEGFALLPQGGVCLVGRREEELPELYKVQDGKCTRLTHINEGRLDFRK